ncbi:MAG: putative Na+/H+ antiporter [Calditrichaeota bacterium]|nr:putative Na+/H+ antiporter [Calditrichota bacterium]
MIDYLATFLFACAIIHTFVAGKFNKMAMKYPEGSMKENIFHFLGEIEVVFGLWLFPLFYVMWYVTGFHEVEHYFNKIAPKMVEPIFVVIIMVMAATRPILNATKSAIVFLSKLIPLPSQSARFYFTILTITPLLGSFITEPAAMTICAIQLANNFYSKKPYQHLMYVTIGLLFVNISIGGTLTHFAAPPVLMVAGKWHWDMAFMLTHFGWRAATTVFVGTALVTIVYLKEFKRMDSVESHDEIHEVKIPAYVTLIHIGFMAWAVLMVHTPVLLVFGFLFFLGWCTISEEYQDELKIKPALLVGFFLAGLVTHGTLQEWWIKPLITSLDDLQLFLGSTLLTAFNDNAAITYLSTLALPEGFSEMFSPDGIKKFAVVAGAVTGGGLTVIANAPNPAGNSILKGYFGPEGINPAKLALFAIPPTVLAGICFMVL